MRSSAVRLALNSILLGACIVLLILGSPVVPLVLFAIGATAAIITSLRQISQKTNPPSNATDDPC